MVPDIPGMVAEISSPVKIPASRAMLGETLQPTPKFTTVASSSIVTPVPFKSFNESNNINNIDSAIISILPQPYDFDSFEPMSDNYQGMHYSLNPKFEDANIGIGSVIRERRKNFVKTWKNIYFLKPLNKAALMHIYPNNWLLFKEENKKYFLKKEFEIKPDNESIFVNL